MSYTTLIIPGLNNSGPEHWQSLFEAQIPGSRRVAQQDWSRPNIIPWARNVQNAILRSDDPVILVAHSFGVLASIVGAARVADKVAGALFVAPADPAKFTPSGEILSEAAQDWSTGLYNLIPKERLGYPTIIAASLDDPYMPFKRAAWWATKWQSRVVSLGNSGHVNVASGHGQWSVGEALYSDIVSVAKSEQSIWRQICSWAY